MLEVAVADRQLQVDLLLQEFAKLPENGALAFAEDISVGLLACISEVRRLLLGPIWERPVGADQGRK